MIVSFLFMIVFFCSKKETHINALKKDLAQ